MSVKILTKKQTVLVGVVIELSLDDATHLSFVLSQARKYCFGPDGDFWGGGGKVWPWLDKFHKELDSARGKGATFGRGLKGDQE